MRPNSTNSEGQISMNVLDKGENNRTAWATGMWVIDLKRI